MGFGQAFLTLGGSVPGFGEFYVGLFWALAFGSAAAIVWTRYRRQRPESEKAPLASGRRR